MAFIHFSQALECGGSHYMNPTEKKNTPLKEQKNYVNYLLKILIVSVLHQYQSNNKGLKIL